MKKKPVLEIELSSDSPSEREEEQGSKEPHVVEIISFGPLPSVIFQNDSEHESECESTIGGRGCSSRITNSRENERTRKGKRNNESNANDGSARKSRRKASANSESGSESSDEPESGRLGSPPPQPSTSKARNMRTRNKRVAPLQGKERMGSGSAKRKRVRFKLPEAVSNNKHDSSSSSDSDDADGHVATSSRTSNSQRNKGRGGRDKTLRRSTRNTKKLKKEDVKENEKELAFQKLREKMARRANKPKRESPVPRQGRSSSEDESDSSYTSGPSPCPIVDESSVESDFNGSSSTPSSSSVTSSGVTDEEPDLEIGGSDGEKDLKGSSEEMDSENEGNDDSRSSSSVVEEPSSPQPAVRQDTRCILCKNLDSADVEGRANVQTPTTTAPDWCKCGECRKFSPLAGDYDLVCCQEIKGVVDFLDEELDDSSVCVTKHSRFVKDVLENEGFARSISKDKDIRSRSYEGGRYSSSQKHEGLARWAKQNFERSNAYQKMWKSLSSYSYWIFDKLGHQACQMVTPACVQYKVREKFGIRPHWFRNFKASYRCPNGRHCRLASESL